MINSTGWLGIHRTKVKQTKKITLTSLSVFIEVRFSYYRIYRDQSGEDFVQKRYFQWDILLVQLFCTGNSIFNDRKIEGKSCYLLEIRNYCKNHNHFYIQFTVSTKAFVQYFWSWKKKLSGRKILPCHIYQEQFCFCLKKN